MAATRSQRRAPRLIATLIAAMAVSGLACTTQPHPSSMAFFEGLRIGGDEAEGWGTIAEMKADSDVVGVATFLRFELGRTLQGDAIEDVMAYGEATLTFKETISGEAPGEQVAVEFVLPGNVREQAATAERLADDLPVGDVLVFLRAKRGTGEDGLYRLVNSTGLWTATTRAALDAPLADAGVGEVYPSETKEIAGFEEFVAYVSSLD